MKKKSLSEALISLSEDIKKVKLLYGWRKPIVEIYSDYVDVEFRIGDSIHCIPVTHADEWRMFSSDSNLCFVLTYYYSDEDEEKC